MEPVEGVFFICDPLIFVFPYVNRPDAVPEICPTETVVRWLD